MIKIYVQGMFGNKYSVSKDLIKRDVGDVFRGQPKEFNDTLDLANKVNDIQRIQLVELLFNKFITPFVNVALFKKGLKELEKQGELYLLPAVNNQL